MRTSTETLIKAMRILSSDIQSDDGVANAAIAEAAQRLEEQQDRIKRLEEALDLVVLHCSWVHHSKKHQHKYGEPCPVVALIEKAKEAKL